MFKQLDTGRTRLAKASGWKGGKPWRFLQDILPQPELPPCPHMLPSRALVQLPYSPWLPLYWAGGKCHAHCQASRQRCSMWEQRVKEESSKPLLQRLCWLAGSAASPGKLCAACTLSNKPGHEKRQPATVTCTRSLRRPVGFSESTQEERTMQHGKTEETSTQSGCCEKNKPCTTLCSTSGESWLLNLRSSKHRCSPDPSEDAASSRPRFASPPHREGTDSGYITWILMAAGRCSRRMCHRAVNSRRTRKPRSRACSLTTKVTLDAHRHSRSCIAVTRVTTDCGDTMHQLSPSDAVSTH